MPGTSRGLVPPALVSSSIVMVVCSVGWGALGVVSIDPGALPMPVHRYLTILLATLTICSMCVHMTARVIRALRAEHAHTRATAATDGGYADGYADGLAAAPAPAVSRLVPSRR